MLTVLAEYLFYLFAYGIIYLAFPRFYLSNAEIGSYNCQIRVIYSGIINCLCIWNNESTCILTVEADYVFQACFASAADNSVVFRCSFEGKGREYEKACTGDMQRTTPSANATWLPSNPQGATLQAYHGNRFAFMHSLGKENRIAK